MSDVKIILKTKVLANVFFFFFFFFWLASYMRETGEILFIYNNWTLKLACFVPSKFSPNLTRQ
jgi:hypothetical protein